VPTELVDEAGLYIVIRVGLEARRRSLSFSASESLDLTGEGESSIISTHPDESLAELGPFFLLLEWSEERLSMLALFSVLFRDFTTSWMDLGVPTPLGRAAELPKRSLGTRV
jgi:hypothetical protein